jgi:hypothetical protein
MKSSEFITEGALTSTVNDLKAIKMWLENNGFGTDRDISPNPQTKWDHADGEHERAEAGFWAEYESSRPVREILKKKFIGVFLAPSKHQKRKVILLNLADTWYELHGVDDTIEKIKEYFKIK